MDLQAITAISPIDGRYRDKTNRLASYYSEFALIKYRLYVEIEYFIALCEFPLPQLKTVSRSVFEALRKIHQDFSIAEAHKVKKIEKITNHDVKAVEYFLKERFDDLGLSEYKEFIHFGLTSQDINNTAVPLLLKESLKKEIQPLLEELVHHLQQKSEEWMDVPMLARTHGQLASPTRMGKEIGVFVERLESQMNLLDQIPFVAKFGGATGNFNAHVVAYPEVDWKNFADSFVAVLGLSRLQLTTQIEHYDNLAALLDAFSRINTILIDFSRDVWQYISMGYFVQKIVENEVGSSAMPHKVNPIDFENAEGNLGMANALFGHLSAKLPVSRLQRDLTDSTVLRNLGVPFSHTLIALQSLRKGLSKILLDRQALEQDLENNWAVVAEAIQTILRREAYPKPYEALKALTRHHGFINRQVIHQFIDDLEVSAEIKSELKKITPFNFIGI